jgi:hypothetical protein
LLPENLLGLNNMMNAQGQGQGFPASTEFSSSGTVPSSTMSEFTDLPLIDQELDFGEWVNEQAEIVSSESTPAQTFGQLFADAKLPSPAPSSESETSQALGIDFSALAATKDDDIFGTSTIDEFGLDLSLLGPPQYQANGSQLDSSSSMLFPDIPADWLQNGQQFGQSSSASFPSSLPTTMSTSAMTILPNQLESSLMFTPDMYGNVVLPSSGAISMKRTATDETIDSVGGSSGQPPKKRGRPAKVPGSGQIAVTPLPKQKRQSSKPTVAKPKAVVPQKYLKDGSASAALGMTEDQILAFPDFDALLLAVAPELKARAIEFGELVENGRRQAAESAQQTRAAKESKLNELTAEVSRLRQGYDQLFAMGRITAEELQAFTQ